MAPPSIKKRAMYQHAANLYVGGQISSTGTRVTTSTSLAQLCREIAPLMAGPDASDLEVDLRRDAVLKLVKRHHQTPRLAGFWQAVLDNAQLSKDDPNRVAIDSRYVARLRAELAAGDPTFAAVGGALEQARAARPGTARVRLLEQAADALDAATRLPGSATARSAGVHAGEHERAHLERVEACWIRIFDLAADEAGSPSRRVLSLARRAIRAGHAAHEAAGALRPDIRFTQRGWGPRHVNLCLPRGGVWVAAVAVVEALAVDPATFDPATVLLRTRRYAVGWLGMATDQIDASELLAQVGWTLLRVGRRRLATIAARASWDTTQAPNVSARRRKIPYELLDLAIELAGVHFAHGDRDTARESLHNGIRAVLDGPAPGGPDDGWGDVVPFLFYCQLVTALDASEAAVDPLQNEWVRALGPGTSTGYPGEWILAGVTAELLTGEGAAAAAATVAKKSRSVLDDPLTVAETQIRNHLSELSDSAPARPPRLESQQRAAALLHELVSITLAEPGVIDRDARRTIEGLARLVQPRHGRDCPGFS